jgi:hypothetical protein
VLDDEDRPRLYLFVYYGDIDELRDYDYGYAKILET